MNRSYRKTRERNYASSRTK
ncbi:hypothetical protein [Cytobacillus praedii]